MRKLRTLFIFAGQGLLTRPFETTLMVLTLTVIFGASLTAVSLVRSGRQELERNLQAFGKDIVHVHRGLKLENLFGGLSVKLTTDDVQLFRETVEGSATAAQVGTVAVEAETKTETKTELKKLSTVLVATDPAWPVVNSSTYEAGGFFTADQDDACVLDSWLARQLFDSTKVVGKTITVRWAGKVKAFTVCGVIADPMSIRERFQGFDILKDARPPILRVLESRNLYLPRSFAGTSKEVMLCLVKLGPGVEPRDGADRIREALGERATKITVWGRGPWIDRLMDSIDVAYVFSNAVWGIFLIITGAMITTIGLLAISSRTVELGIRRTQGATRRGICGQILFEGLLLGGCGAVLGFAATPLVGAWLCRNLPWNLTLRVEDVVLVLCAGIVVVLGSFLAPALRAAKLEPVEVLREL